MFIRSRYYANSLVCGCVNVIMLIMLCLSACVFRLPSGMYVCLPVCTQYKFIVEDKAALPVDPSFWDYLMGSSQREWGLLVYEQDWLDVQFAFTKAL